MVEVMKVLQISTSTSGGAGLAAKHLSGLLNSTGVDSRLITRESLPGSQNKIANLESISGKFATLYQRSILSNNFDLVTPISIGHELMQTILNFKPDVVHIHNWYNLLSINQIASIGGAFPIVFTLHDERLLTGGCHITLDCNQFSNGCRSCPAVVWNKKLISRSYLKSMEAFRTIKRFGILAPSNWLIEKAKLSPILQDAVNFETIPNVSVIEDFSLFNRSSGDSQGHLRLIFVAADLSAKVKNLRIALEAVNLYSKHSKFNKITLTIVGKNFPTEIVPYGSFEVIHHSYLETSSLMEILRSSDVIVISSRSENSPNIIPEAQLNGVVVIASSVGGIPELIEDGETGFLAECSPEGIASALKRYESCQNKVRIIKLARERAEKRCDREIILGRHLDFYKKVAYV